MRPAQALKPKHKKLLQNLFSPYSALDATAKAGIVLVTGNYKIDSYGVVDKFFFDEVGFKILHKLGLHYKVLSKDDEPNISYFLQISRTGKQKPNFRSCLEQGSSFIELEYSPSSQEITKESWVSYLQFVLNKKYCGQQIDTVPDKLRQRAKKIERFMKKEFPKLNDEYIYQGAQL